MKKIGVVVILTALALVLRALPACAAGEVYWTHEKSIYFSAPPYDTQSLLYTHSFDLTGLAVDTARGWAFATFNSGAVMKVSLPSGTPEGFWVGTPTAGVVALDTAAGHAYFVTDQQVIHRKQYLTASPLVDSEGIVTAPSQIGAIAVDKPHNKIYFTCPSLGRVYRADMQVGASSEEVTTISGAPPPLPTGITLRGGRIYVSLLDRGSLPGSLFSLPTDAAVPLSTQQLEWYDLGDSAPASSLAPAPLESAGADFSLFATQYSSGGSLVLVTKLPNGTISQRNLFAPPGATPFLYVTADSCSGDSDGDGVDDCSDQCPQDASKITAGVCGCGTPDTDSDGDGTANCHDSCPADPAKTAAGVCGCGQAETGDTDSDGALDCVDSCAADPLKTAAGICGCGTPDTDSNGDGTIECGGAALPTDSDGDGTPDLSDGCPYDPGKTAVGFCGCGRAEIDSDANAIPDCLDVSGLLAPILTPATQPLPPQVVLRGKNALVYMERFSGVALEVAAAGRSKKLSYRYEVVLSAAGNRSALVIQGSAARTQRRIARRNRVTYRALKTGSYSVTYRLRILQGSRTVASTSWSPKTTFTIAPKP